MFRVSNIGITKWILDAEKSQIQASFRVDFRHAFGADLPRRIDCNGKVRHRIHVKK